MSEEEHYAIAAKERKESVPETFYYWLKQAEAIVDANYKSDTPGQWSALVISLANSMMMQHKLGEIELTLDEIKMSITNIEMSV